MKYVYVLFLSMFLITGCATSEPVETEPEIVLYDIYFFNDGIASVEYCDEAVPVPRTAETNEKLPEIAIAALLNGPTESETEEGYSTEIPPETVLQSLNIQNGIATIDFTETLNSGGGSCSMTGRRAQIERTLRQFPDIRSVLITVNGDTETALQP